MAGELGILKEMQETMRSNKDAPGVQAQACLTLRNMVYASRDMREKAGDSGIKRDVMKAAAIHSNEAFVKNASLSALDALDGAENQMAMARPRHALPTRTSSPGWQQGQAIREFRGR